MSITKQERNEKQAIYYALNRRKKEFQDKRAEIRKRSYDKKKNKMKELEEENDKLKKEIDILNEMVEELENSI